MECARVQNTDHGIGPFDVMVDEKNDLIIVARALRRLKACILDAQVL